MGEDLWGVVLVLGPIALVSVMIWAWLSNRQAAQTHGEAALGTTNAVEGSDKARPDLAQDIARAEAGEKID